MRDVVYLVCNADGYVRATKRPPSLYREEVAVKVAVNVPDSCFRSWVFGAEVSVPEDRVIHPDIEVEALEEVAPTPSDNKES